MEERHEIGMLRGMVSPTPSIHDIVLNWMTGRGHVPTSRNGLEWLRAAIHLSATVALLTSNGEVTTIPALLTTGLSPGELSCLRRGGAKGGGSPPLLP